MDPIDSLIQSLEMEPLESSGHIYHPIPFDRFKPLRSSTHSRATHRKYALIRSALPFQDFGDRRLLDVGANAGFFTYKFAQLGAHVDAIEPHQRYFELGLQVTDHYGVDVNWHKQPIDVEFLQGRKYDIALMLSVFQWMSKGNTDLATAKLILREISKRADYLFFELGCNWGKSSIQVERSALRWILELLEENTVYSEIGYLGTVRAWGKIRTMWRYRRYLFCCTDLSVNLNAWQHLVTRSVQRW